MTRAERGARTFALKTDALKLLDLNQNAPHQLTDTKKVSNLCWLAFCHSKKCC
jgi:hypothetical protein